MEKVQGFAENGLVTVTVGGLSATQKFMGSYGQGVVTVYNTGTLVLSTIYSDNSSTPKANPFTSSTTGYWFFYAANGRYDVTFSGGGLAAPLTFGDVLLADPFASGGAVTSFNGRTGVVVPASNDYSVAQLSGLPVTVAQGGTSAITLTGILEGHGTSAVTGNAAATELTYLRRKPNNGATAAYEFSALPYLLSSDYAFTAQTPGGSLIIGSNTITIAPVPLGVNGADTAHYLYISAGTGTAEPVLITGGTAVSGATTGTVIVTCAATHTGAWTIQSATAGIQEALNLLPSLGGTVVVATGLNTIQGKITINGNGNVPRICIQGIGGPLLRGTAYPAGDLIYLNGTSATAAVSIRNLEIYAAGVYASWVNVSSGAAIHLYNSSGSIHVIEDVRIDDGYIGVHIEGTQQVTVRNLNYSQQNMAPSTIPLAAILVNGVSSLALPPTSIHITGGVVTTTGPTDADGLIAGILIQNVDGLLVDSIQIGGGVAHGILIQGLNACLIANVYIDHILLDSIRTYGIRAYQASGTAALISGITISNSHINGQNSVLTANTTVDGIRLEAGSVWLIVGNQIRDWGSNGIQLLSGGAIDGVTIASNKIYDNNYGNSAAISGISVNTTGSSKLVITGNDIRNYIGSGFQKYGITIFAASSKVVIADNALSGNVTGTILLTATPTEFAMSNNEGWVNNIPAVASGASIAAPSADTFTITGTTAITTITGGWAGRNLTLIFTNATPGGVGTGGNIGRTQAAAQNQSLRLSYNGTNWY